MSRLQQSGRNERLYKRYGNHAVGRSEDLPWERDPPPPATWEKRGQSPSPAISANQLAAIILFTIYPTNTTLSFEYQCCICASALHFSGRRVIMRSAVLALRSLPAVRRSDSWIS